MSAVQMQRMPTNDDAAPGNDVPWQQAMATISAALGETDETALRQLGLVVRSLGSEQALALLSEALHIEAQGGLLTRDTSRRRTLGGVYFHLARARVSLRDHRLIWPDQPLPRPAPGFERSVKRPKPPASAPAPFDWEGRAAVYQQVTSQQGEARIVKVTLIGRPGRVIEQGQCVITAMKPMKSPTLPKGMPAPPATATSYGVYIARRHWLRVAEALQNPEDLLIVEGFAAYDPKLQGVAVFATNVTTKHLQAARRQTNDDA